MRGFWLALTLSACGRLQFDPLADATSSPRCAPAATLVACYAFDGNAQDSSLAGNHAVGPVAYVAGRAGMAAQFGAAADLRVADSASLDFGTALTVSAWIHMDALPNGGRGVLVDRNNGFAFFIDGTGHLALTFMGDAGSYQVSAPEVIPLATWTHVAGVYDGSVLWLYIGGVAADTGGAAGVILTADTLGTRIGGGLPSGEPFRGAIDDLGIWNVGLPASAICAAAGSC